jgi:uncharacterized protein YjbJ (UPF0337 family)
MAPNECLSSSMASAGYQDQRAGAFNPQHQEQTMNKDQTKGRIEEAKGKIKEIAGQVVGDKDLELKGKIQNTGGKAQAAYGDVKADLKKVVQGK